MRYLYLLLLTTLLAEPLRAQSPKLVVDVVPLNLPYQSLSARMYSQHNCGNPNCGLRSTVWAFYSNMRQANAEDKATVSFFTSYAKTDLRIRTEGITPAGMPGLGRSVVRIE